MQLRSNVSTRKVSALVGMSQSFVAHLRKDAGARLRDKDEGVQSFLQTERRGVVSLFLLKVNWFLYMKQLRTKTCELLSDITIRHVLREVGLGAQVQQRKPSVSRKHDLGTHEICSKV